MAYDQRLAERIRDLLGARAAVSEREMFGGITWMLSGNMACGVIGEDLLVRLGEDDARDALAGPHVSPFVMSGRRASRNFVIVAAQAVAGDAELARWVDAGAAFAASLPPKE